MQPPDDIKQANELFIKTVESIEQAEREGVSLEEKIRLYQQGVDSLNRIIKEYPSTDLAVKLISDQRIGKIQRSEVEKKLKNTQIKYTIEEKLKRIQTEVGENVKNFSSKEPVRTLEHENVVTLEHDSSVLSVAYSPDGRHIASGSRDGTVRVWDAATGQLVRTLMTWHEGDVNSVAYSPDGRHIASGSYKEIRVWDAASGVLLHTLEHQDWVRSVAYSPDGRYIASGSDDNTVRVCDAASGALLHTLTGHWNSAWSVAYSPDGRHIASGSADNTMRVWDAATGQLVSIPVGGILVFGV